ncbi:MAG: hypothetical protein E5Y14_03855 [Mesorhizobium sp.]|nr:MAG: hypothetical protein E5Y14_03855 [Mesorhizobium sp.]
MRTSCRREPAPISSCARAPIIWSRKWRSGSCNEAVNGGQLGLPVAIPILLTCILLPVVNFVVLERWIFSGRSAAGLGRDTKRVPVLGKSDA